MIVGKPEHEGERECWVKDNVRLTITEREDREGSKGVGADQKERERGSM